MTTELPDRLIADLLRCQDEGIVALDVDLRYIFVNDAAEQLVGLRRDQVLGRTPMELFPSEVVDAILPHIIDARRTGRMSRYDAYYPAGDRWYEHRLYPSTDGVLVFFRDVTAQKAAERQLREREEAQRFLVSLTGAMRLVADPADVQWTLVTLVGEYFGVSRCVYGEIDPSGEQVTVSSDYVRGVGSMAGRQRLEDFGPELIRDLKRGETLAVADLADDPRTADRRVREAFAATQTRALLCVPLLTGSRLVGLIALHHWQPREWSPGDVSLLEQVARQTSLALENTRALAALRESRDVLTLAMRGGRMGAWSRNLATDQVWWSRELEQLFGLSPGGFDGSEAGFLAFVHDEDRPRLEAAVAAAIADASDYVVEFRFRHATQGWRWMDGRGRAVRSDDGTLRALFGVGIDITERKQTELALASARDAADADAARLGLALLTARLGEWKWDPGTDVVTLSARAAEIFGQSDREMTWAAMRDLLHPDDREPARLAVEAAVAGRSDYRIEYRVVFDGRERWVSASGRARYDDGGVPLEMFGVVQDITRDRLLIRLDDEVRPLSDSAQITFVAARVLGEHLEVNRCAYAVVDADQDSFELTGNYTNGVPSIVGRYRFRQFGAECLRLMRAGAPYVVEDSETDPRLDETDRQSYRATAIRGVICIPILKGDRFVAAMAVHTNLPRRWRPEEVQLVVQVASRCWESLERARVESERVGLLVAAQQANRAKDEFLAMLGHELRNPLSPILTALQLMRLKGDDSSQRERTVIERQVTHLTRLIDDLLDVSRIARGKVELKLEAVEVADVVARAIEIASPLLEERRQTLVVDVPRSGLVLNADPARLGQVVSNLLTNAAKYTPHGGRVVLSATAQHGSMELRVSDNGIGIAADVLPRVFDLFVQGVQATDRAQGGLGLGLTIVKNLVEQHGGQVAAFSDGADKGSEFVVTLPLVDTVAVPAGASTAVTRTVAWPRDAMRVLVVDDNRDAAEMVAAALTARGIDARVAHDGPAALQIAAEYRPGVAFLDLGLPVMDGYELAERLRQMPGLAQIRLIAVTGYGQETDRQRTAASGFYQHLVKPVDLDALVALIHP